MFFVIPLAGFISLICYSVMRTYTRMFDIAQFADDLMRDTQQSELTSHRSS